MRKAMSAGAVGLACVFVGGLAGAQGRRGGGGHGAPQGSSQPGQGAAPAQGGGGGGTVTRGGKGYHPQPFNLHKQALGSEAIASAARARMRNDDCAGALDLFDQALATSTNPTLNRDRGLCQERLGNPYPAIDDYRVYLTNAPDAADADGIRQRLARLEMDVYHHSSESTDTPDEAAASTGGNPPPPAATVSVEAGPERKRDAMEDVEHDHDEMRSPLRAGNGVSLAPFFAEHKWFAPGTSFGDSTTWAETVGLQFRYSFGPQSALVVEAGYEVFNATDVATVSGLSSLVGYELRVPLDPGYDNQFLLGAGMGFEYLVLSPKEALAVNESTWGFVPRLRLGWRHMVTASVGLDLALDGGLAFGALSQSSGFLGNQNQPTEMLAVNFGVAWGL